MRQRVADAAAAMAGRVTRGDAERCFDGAAIDSRRLAGGELFFAVAGTRTDGHRFVGAALAAGAAAAAVSRADVELPASLPRPATLIEVADTYEALHALTRASRRLAPRRLVGVTGSVGKTSTKELLAAMLGRRFKVAASPGNLNNLYGFPLALLGIPADSEWMVAEMGMSEPGEMAQISRLARPDVALLLNVRPAHMENFADLDAVADAKAEILEGLSKDGLLVASADDPRVLRIARRHAGRCLLFGYGAAATVRASAPRALPDGRPGSRFTLTAAGERVEVELALHGHYNVDNCLAAAACAHALGVPLADIAAAAATARPAAGRGEVHHLAGGVTLIDDSYNSNPDALERALDSAARLPARRHLAVLGEMLELGPEAARFHRRAGRQAAAAGFAPLAAVGGEAAGELAAAAGGQWLPDAASAAEWLAGQLEAGDLVLVKGSRGIALERVAERLRAIDPAPARQEGVA